jgi:murein DD-endopeptidase MepM/ murein hydrolase activator NlpD
VRRVLVLLLCVLALPATASADPEANARARLATITRRLQDAEAREGVLADRLKVLDRDLETTTKRLNAIRKRFGARASAVYKSGLGADTLVVMLNAPDPSTVIDRLDLLNAAARNDDVLLREAAGLARRLREQRRAADETRDDTEAVRRALAKDAAEVRSLLDRLAAQDATRNRVTRASGAARATRSRAPLHGRYACLVGPAHAFSDTWGAPRSGGRRHMGTDVFAPMGSPAYAVTDGVVTRTSTSSNGGLQVYLRGNDGNEYFYAHMSSYVAHAGQRVSAGQEIARVGDTGNARGGAPHVHFEVHPGGGYPVNPYPYVRRFCG